MLPPREKGLRHARLILARARSLVGAQEDVDGNSGPRTGVHRYSTPDAVRSRPTDDDDDDDDDDDHLYLRNFT